MKYPTSLFYTILVVHLYFIVETLPASQDEDNLLAQQKRDHLPKILDASTLVRISAELSDIADLKEDLKAILVPRVPGTEGHDTVNKFIIERMMSLGWHVDTDKFVDKTPNFGDMEFENIIATVNPNAKRYLTLACHYDSKYMPKFEFVGATDSAVSMAIMFNMAKRLDKYYKTLAEAELSLQFIFFDGDEAFWRWSAEDSTYGARHLAAKWEQDESLRKMDLLVILDLLGAENPAFLNYLPSGSKWFHHIRNIEQRLNEYAGEDCTNYFQPDSPRDQRYQTLDDHIPFMERNVPVLHLVPSPYPDQWHHKTDNEENIDYATIPFLNKYVGIFTLEYLHCLDDSGIQERPEESLTSEK